MLSEERGVKGSNREMAPMLQGAMPLLLGARERKGRVRLNTIRAMTALRKVEYQNVGI